MPVKKRNETAKTAPLEFLRSFNFRPGRIKRQSSQKTYGKEMMKPITNDARICIVNWPVIYRLCTLKGNGFAHRASVAPVSSPSLHNHLKVGNEIREGAKMIFSNTQGVKTKATIVSTMMAIIDLT